MILMIRARARAFKFFSKKKTANRARAESNRNALFRTNRTERPRRRRRRTLPHARVVIVVHRVVRRDARRPKRPTHFFDRSPNRSEPTRPVRWDERARRHERDTPDDPVARAFALAFAHALVRPSVARIRRPSVRPSVARVGKPNRRPFVGSKSASSVFRRRRPFRRPSSRACDECPTESRGYRIPRARPFRRRRPSSVASSSSSSSPEHAPRRIKPTQTPVRARMRTTTSRAGWTNR